MQSLHHLKFPCYSEYLVFQSTSVPHIPHLFDLVSKIQNHLPFDGANTGSIVRFCLFLQPCFPVGFKHNVECVERM